jgi:hypothetical protein
MYPAQISAPNFPLNALLRPKACLACRLAHASCDRYPFRSHFLFLFFYLK